MLIGNNNLLQHAVYTTIVGNYKPYLVRAFGSIPVNGFFAGAGCTVTHTPLPGLCSNGAVGKGTMVFIGTIHIGYKTGNRRIDMNIIMFDHRIGTTFVGCNNSYMIIARIAVLI